MLDLIEQAEKKGFNPTYKDSIVPLYVQEWMMEKYAVYVQVQCYNRKSWGYVIYLLEDNLDKGSPILEWDHTMEHESHHGALISGLKAALSLF